MRSSERTSFSSLMMALAASTHKMQATAVAATGQMKLF